MIIKKGVPTLYKKKLSMTSHHRVTFILPAICDQDLQGVSSSRSYITTTNSDAMMLQEQDQQPQPRRQRYMRRGSKTSSMLMAAQRILEATTKNLETEWKKMWL